MSTPISGQDPAATGGQVPPLVTHTPEGQDPEGKVQTPNPAQSTPAEEEITQEHARALKALVEKLRPFEKSADKLAREKADLEAKVKTYEDEKLSEADKITRRLKDLEDENKTLLTEKSRLLTDSVLERAARAVGAKEGKYLDLVVSELRSAAIEFGEDGRPVLSTVEAALGSIRKDLPDLFAQTTPQGALPPTPQGQPTNPAKGKPLTVEMIKAMSEEEVNSRWDDIEQVLRTSK